MQKKGAARRANEASDEPDQWLLEREEKDKGREQRAPSRRRFSNLVQPTS